jgi:hypothetical protein
MLRNEYVITPRLTPFIVEYDLPRFLIIAGLPIRGPLTASPAATDAEVPINLLLDMTDFLFFPMIELLRFKHPYFLF